VRLYSAEMTFRWPPPPGLFDEGHVAVRAPAIHRVLAARAVQLHSLRHAKLKRENISTISGRTGGIVGHFVNRWAAERTSEPPSKSRWSWMAFLLENGHARQCSSCNTGRQFAVILKPTCIATELMRLWPGGLDRQISLACGENAESVRRIPSDHRFA
jgi:hypothetical protein